MDVADITPHLDQLDGDLDKLEDALKPILADLGEVASRLPLLDKAKLYVLATYSLETSLFSALRLNGTDAKTHPVFKELTRVRQYYEKIKKAEEPPAERKQAIDTQAAIRFIKADLSDNKDINAKLREKLAIERAKAAAKAAEREKEKSKKRSADEAEGAATGSSKVGSPAVDSSAESGQVDEPQKKKAKKSTGGHGKGDKKSKKNKKK